MALRFSWDLFKAASSLRKHGVSFREAMTAFEDALSITVADPDHSTDEMRFILTTMTLRKLSPIHPGEILGADFLEIERDHLGARLSKEVRILDRAG
jgi:hypothetical protein